MRLLERLCGRARLQSCRQPSKTRPALAAGVHCFHLAIYFSAIGTFLSEDVAYTVPKLKSFTPAALDKAVEKLLAALKLEAAAVKNEADWKVFRDRWMARKNGVLTEINDLWLKAAPKEAKREVGQRVNSLKSKVEWQVDNTYQEITQLDALDKLIGPNE